jgi:hypothetical protein
MAIMMVLDNSCYYRLEHYYQRKYQLLTNDIL